MHKIWMNISMSLLLITFIQTGSQIVTINGQSDDIMSIIITNLAIELLISMIMIIASWYNDYTVGYYALELEHKIIPSHTFYLFIIVSVVMNALSIHYQTNKYDLNDIMFRVNCLSVLTRYIIFAAMYGLQKNNID